MKDKKHAAWWMAGAVALGVIGFALWHSGNSSTLAGFTAAPQSTVPPALASDASPVALAPSPTTDVVVYVCGSVHKPGIYHLTSGLRIADAISKAGGALVDADLEQLNLAQVLSDAMKVDVPKKGQTLAGVSETSSDSVGAVRHRSGRHSGRSSHKLQPGQTLDVNTATESELTQLPGVGPGLARRIIEYRTANGPFQTVDDLQNVSGIGPSKFDRMAPYVRL